MKGGAISQAENPIPTEINSMVTNKRFPDKATRKRCKERAEATSVCSQATGWKQVGSAHCKTSQHPRGAPETLSSLLQKSRHAHLLEENAGSQIAPLMSPTLGYPSFILCYISTGGRQEKAFRETEIYQAHLLPLRVISKTEKSLLSFFFINSYLWPN